MPDDARLKSSTRQAFGRKRKRPWNKKPKLSAASAPPRSAPPDALDLPETSAGDIATPCSSGSLSSFASAVRVDTAYYSTAEQAQRVARSDECKRALSEKSATQRKFDLLGVTTGGQTRDAGTQFIVVDMKALKAWRRTIRVRPTLPTRAAAMQSRGSPGNTKLEQLGTTVLDSCEGLPFQVLHEQRPFSGPNKICFRNVQPLVPPPVVPYRVYSFFYNFILHCRHYFSVLYYFLKVLVNGLQNFSSQFVQIELCFILLNIIAWDPLLNFMQ